MDYKALYFSLFHDVSEILADLDAAFDRAHLRYAKARGMDRSMEWALYPPLTPEQAAQVRQTHADDMRAFLETVGGEDALASNTASAHSIQQQADIEWRWIFSSLSQLFARMDDCPAEAETLLKQIRCASAYLFAALPPES